MIQQSLESKLYSHSFLINNQKNKFIAYDTFAYIIGEFKLDSYNIENGFFIQNPLLNSPSNILSENNIFLDFRNKDKEYENINIQVLIFSSSLFTLKLKELGDVLVSNIIYLKFLNKKKEQNIKIQENLQIQKLRIKFSLLFLPSYDDILSNVYCKAYNLFSKGINLNGKAKLYDEQDKTITCEFDENFDFKGYYFALTILK